MHGETPARTALARKRATSMASSMKSVPSTGFMRLDQNLQLNDQTNCDPRLKAEQSVELAFELLLGYHDQRGFET